MAVCLPGNPRDWTVVQVCQWLRLKDLGQFAAVFEANGVDGSCLADGLDDDSLTMIGVKLPSVRKRIQTEIKALFPATA